MELCFECSQPANDHHHVIPKVKGGTKTVPLCFGCHGKVHDLKRNRPISFSELIKEGIQKAKARGQYIGGKKKYSAETINYILNLHAKSKNPKEISELLDIPRESIRDIIERESCRIQK